MRVRVVVAALALAVLSACNPATDPARVIAEAGPSRAAWLPEHYTISARSALLPEPLGDGAISFRLAPGRCTRHTDATGLSDCAAGRSRAVLSGGGIYRLGHQYLHSFEIFVPADFAVRSGGARLVVARWQGADGPDRRLFDLELDARRGLSFRGQVCVPPSGFGAWHRVFVRLRWAEGPEGFFELRCGAGAIHGAPLVAALPGIATARTPRGEVARRFEIQLGLIHDGAGAGRLASETEIRMRRIAERRLYVIFGLAG